jgi:hypothetical protein
MDAKFTGRPHCNRARKGDGTITSVCNRCDLTIACAFDTADLDALEFRHVCQPAERRQTFRIVHRTYDPGIDVGDHFANRWRQVLKRVETGLSLSAKIELITTHLLLQPCCECSNSAELLNPENEEQCFRCHLSLKQRWTELAPLLPAKSEISHFHEVQFYSEDEVFLRTFTRFIGTALKSGDAIIVAVTEIHRISLCERLEAQGLDLVAAVEQRRYIPLDAADTLSTFMVDDFPDQDRFEKVAGAVVAAAANGTTGGRRHVAACGECAPLLWKEGKTRAAIRLEQLWDKIARIQSVDILCGYPGSVLRREQGRGAFQSICAEHSAVYCQ